MRSMECTGIVSEKFCIELSSEDTMSNKLKIPTKFMMKYSYLLDDSLEIKLRNGYVQSVKIDKKKCQMKGVKWVFNNFELKGGELLVFEYFGRSKINLYIIGSNCSEIRYPDIVHCLQRCSPGIVTVVDGGWRFVTTRANSNAVIDYIDPPAAFIDQCGRFLPKRIIYLLSNGKKFVGSYDFDTCRFLGLKALFDIVGLDVMIGVRHILFAFDGTKSIIISAFDLHFNEIVFQGTPLCMDANGAYPLIGNYFQITVETKHMLHDCFAVDIDNEFKDVSEQWEKIQCINVFSGDCCWRLLIRKRDDYPRTTIEDGWQKLRDDLGLIVGNHCVFECPVQSYDQFRIRVLKPDEY